MLPNERFRVKGKWGNSGLQVPNLREAPSFKVEPRKAGEERRAK
jgi:hypothetical protein